MKNTLSALLSVIAALSFAPAVLAANAGDFSGAVAIGTGYAGISSAPTNGLIVQGNVGIGTTVPASLLQVYGTSAVLFDRFQSGSHLLLRTAGGTVGSPTALSSGDELGQLSFGGYDGSAWSSTGPSVQSYANENWSSSDHSGYLTFSTIPSSSTTSAEVMRITAAGNVGIDTPSPSGLLEIRKDAGSTVNSALILTNGTDTGNAGSNLIYNMGNNASNVVNGVILGDYSYSGTTGSETDRFSIQVKNTGTMTTRFNVDYLGNVELQQSGGNVGIANTSPSYLLHVGSSSASGAVAGFQNSADLCTLTPAASTPTWSCSSDVRLKTDIADTGNALRWPRGVRVRDFTMKATGERQTGVVAQELKTVHPDMVHMGSNGFLMVNSPNPWMLVKAIQELDNKITEQQKEIDALKHTAKQGAGAQ